MQAYATPFSCVVNILKSITDCFGTTPRPSRPHDPSPPYGHPTHLAGIVDITQKDDVAESVSHDLDFTCMPKLRLYAGEETVWFP